MDVGGCRYGMEQSIADEPVDPDVDFERLKAASLSLAVILVEAAQSPNGQAVVGFSQIKGIHEALSDAMLGYAWLRDEVVGAERGDSLMAQLEEGLSQDDEKMLTHLFTAPALKAD